MSSLKNRPHFLGHVPGLRILMYHSIGDRTQDPYAITAQEFEQQIVLATKVYDVVDLKEVLEKLTWQQPLWGMGKIVITFDDAYRDFLTTAVPILARYSIPATLFVPTGFVGKTSQWHSYDKNKPLLTWDEIREVHKMGYAIASHTVSHPLLTQCTDKVLEFELIESFKQLKSEIDSPLPVLSYPGGYRGIREMKAVRRTGYLAAVGVTSRFANYPCTNRYHLRRCHWNPDNS